MNALPMDAGCGSPGCHCVAPVQGTGVARVNGVALHAPGDLLPPEVLRELACTELLRQEAVRQGLLDDAAVSVAPQPDEQQRAVIERMVDQAAKVPPPDESACRRYYEANKARLVQGQALRVRHILFAVTPGVDVHALSVRAETALLDLLRKDAPEGRFAELARTMSNCPSAADGGELGWLTPNDCAPELANELFFQSDSNWGMGVHPRLVHTRHGFHIIEVLGRRKGHLPAFEELHVRIAGQLTLNAQVTAIKQYLQVLAGQAQIEGVDLDGADTPLVQ